MLQVLLLHYAVDDVIETLVVYHCSVFLILFPCCIHVHIQGTLYINIYVVYVFNVSIHIVTIDIILKLAYKVY